jgi:hypothetical protein
LLTSKNAREFFVPLSEQAGKNTYNRTGASVFENETADLCLRVHLSPGAEIRRDIKSHLDGYSFHNGNVLGRLQISNQFRASAVTHTTWNACRESCNNFH